MWPVLGEALLCHIAYSHSLTVDCQEERQTVETVDLKTAKFCSLLAIAFGKILHLLVKATLLNAHVG